MKFRFFNTIPAYYIVMALLTCVMSGCVDEYVPQDDNVGKYIDGYFAIKVQVPTEDVSRADESTSPNFTDGTESEHAINPNGEHVLIYIDQNWNYAGYEKLNFSGSHTDEKTTQNLEATFSCQIKTDKDYLNNLPAHGLMVINGHNIINKLNVLSIGSSSIQNVLTITDDASGTHTPGRDGQYFTMTNSAYLVNNSGTWVHNIVFDIDKSKVFDSE